MERKIKRLIAYALFGLVGLIEAVEWITVLHEHIPPSLMSYIDQRNAVVLFIVGILFLFLGLRSAEEDVQMPPLAPIPSPSITNQVNPTITVINHPAEARPLQQPTSAAIPRPEPRHNVKYVRVQEFSPDSPLIFAACFENLPIPNQEIRTFNNVKVRTDYKHSDTEQTYLTLFPSAWTQVESDEVYMQAGKPITPQLQ